MVTPLETLRDVLSAPRRHAALPRAALGQLAADLAVSDPRAVEELLAVVVAARDEAGPSHDETRSPRDTTGSPRDEAADALVDTVLDAVLARLWQRPPSSTGPSSAGSPTSAASAAVAPDGRWSPQLVDAVSRAYRRLGPHCRPRHHLLRALAQQASEPALAAFAELLASDPPARAEEIDLACVPLFQRPKYPAEALFPRLLEAVTNPAAAAIALDLANHVTRRGLVREHPAQARVDQLAALLGALVGELGRLEEHPDEYARDALELARRVGQGVQLAVSLCDSLALIGQPRVTPCLHQALALGHRRLRTEAAAALVRLGDDAGLDVLVEMAAEPAARCRALAYLAELDHIDRVDDLYRSPRALAEGQLAAWLTERAGLGLAPSQIEYLDERRLRWPGYEEPVDCYLFRFVYHLPGGELTGIGIAGPIVYWIRATLEHLSLDELYALYAGWCVEHPQIREVAAHALAPAARERIEPQLARLRAEGLRDVELVKVGDFFGERLPVVSAWRRDQQGTVVLDPERTCWYPSGGGPRPLGPGEAYFIHIGRKLLGAFNPVG